MRTSFRWLAAALGLGLAVAVAPAARAHNPTVVLTTPDDGASVTNSVIVTGSVEHQRQLSHFQYLSSWSVRVAPLWEGADESLAVQRGGTAPASSERIDISEIFEGFVYNGPYQITLRGTAGTSTATDVRAVQVRVPPVAPREVRTAINPQGTVAVAWTETNTEPDLLGYIVERAYNRETRFACAGMVVAAENRWFFEDLANRASGDYRYRVRAVRKADPADTMPTCGNRRGVESAASGESKVTWTPGTTTTAPGSGPTTTRPGAGGAGGGSAGGSGGGTGGGGGTAAPRRPDLGNFTLDGQRAMARPPTRSAPLEVDTGFSEFLPFGPTGEAEGAFSDQPLAQSRFPDEEDNGVTTLLFFAAFLLVVVLLGHVLWIKGEVDRVPLEALAPEDTPL